MPRSRHTDITKSVVEKVLNRRVHTNLTIVAPENGAILTPRPANTNEHLDVEISWSTLLLDGSLKVFLDKVDVTSKFWVDNDELKATGFIDAKNLVAIH